MDMADQLVLALLRAAPLPLLHQSIDIAAAATRLAGAGDEHRVNISAGTAFFEARRPFVDHGERESVAPLGPVQGDGGNTLRHRI